jgi:hypothetical protein
VKKKAVMPDQKPILEMEGFIGHEVISSVFLKA